MNLAPPTGPGVRIVGERMFAPTSNVGFARVRVGLPIRVKGECMKQSIELMAAELREECATWEGARYNFFLCTSGRAFWLTPKMLCWGFREACSGMYALMEGERMAKSNSESVKNEEKALWVFIDLKLSEDEMEAGLLTWKDDAELWDITVQTMLEGYKVSLSHEAESDSYCAALTGKDCVPENQNKTITAWYDTAIDALRLVLYKHHVASGGVWGTSSTRGKRRG